VGSKKVLDQNRNRPYPYHYYQAKLPLSEEVKDELPISRRPLGYSLDNLRSSAILGMGTRKFIRYGDGHH
jgi:hypothetical protein